MRVSLPSFFAIVVALLVGPTAAAENWPEFRGPHANGYADAKDLPAEFGDGLNMKWKTPVPGKAWSTPVIWGNQIWVTNATEDGKVLSAVCLDKSTGKVLHDRKVFEIAEPQFCHAFNSYASSTPVIEEGRVYVHFGSPGTACLDTKTGEVLWARQDLPCNHHRAAGSSPVSIGNALFISFDGFDQQYVVMLDKATGKTLWKKDRSIQYGTDDGDRRKAYGTPAVIEVGGRTQIVSPAAVGTVAYDAETGDEVWNVKHGGMNAAARPVFGFGKLFITTGDGGFKLFTVRPDGKGDVTQSHVEWKADKGVPSRVSPMLIGEQLYMMNETGIMTCLEASTGKQIWQKRLGGNYSASPVFADGKMYFASQDGACPVIEPGPEFKLVAENKLPDGCMASPIAVGKSLFYRTKTHVYCFEKP